MHPHTFEVAFAAGGNVHRWALGQTEMQIDEVDSKLIWGALRGLLPRLGRGAIAAFLSNGGGHERSGFIEVTVWN
jgi:hypothetical protein